MASDRRQFERAYDHWCKLHFNGEFSVDRELGTTAIIASSFPHYKNKNEEYADEFDKLDLTEFSGEALQIEKLLLGLGRKVRTFIGATAQDFIDIIRNPLITDIYTIGHGSISDIFLNGAKKGLFDWRDVAKATTHLKTGSFIQRQCGLYTRDISVPLGLFVVNDPTNIYAALDGDVFYPNGIDDEENDKVGRIFPFPTLIDYDSIKEFFQYEEVSD